MVSNNLMSLMRLTIRHWSGDHAQGVLLVAAGLTMRVAVQGQRDAVEYHFSGGQWFAESGGLVEIDCRAVPLGPQSESPQGTFTIDRPRAGGDTSSWRN